MLFARLGPPDALTARNNISGRGDGATVLVRITVRLVLAVMPVDRHS